MALFFAGVVGAAQAVSIGWTDWKSYDGTWTKDAGESLWNNASTDVSSGFGMKLTFKLLDTFSPKEVVTQGGHILSITTDSGEPKCYAFKTALKDGKVVFAVDDYSNGIAQVNSDIVLERGKAYELLFSYDVSAKTVSAYVDGACLITYENRTFDTITEVDLGIAAGGSQTTILSNHIEGYEAFTAGSVSISTTPVPEPTALALLALGMAGLALRRRVA